MQSATERVRAAIEAFHRHWADAELSWWRRTEHEEPWRASSMLLLSKRSSELLDEATKERGFDTSAFAAVQAQRAFMAYRAQVSRARPYVASMLETEVPCGSEGMLPKTLLLDLFRASSGEATVLRARSLAAVGDNFASHACDLKDEALAASLAIVDAPAHLEATKKEAIAFLDATDDAARDMVRWLVRSGAPQAPLNWSTLCFCLRRSDLDGLAHTERRFHRLAAGFRRLGFERDMNARLHAESAEPVLFPFLPRVQARNVPTDARIASTSFQLGVLTDLYGVAAVGGGLALTLVSPALAVEHRYPCGQSMVEAFSMLAMQLRADPLYIRKLEDLPEHHAETLTRHAAVCLLLIARASAAVDLAGMASARNQVERRDALGRALSRALCVEVPSGFAAFAWLSLPPFGSDIRGKLAGLALHAGLRERFDEDWFLNPRAAEPLRGAAARGNTLDVAEMCAEQGTSLSVAAPRLLELLR